MEIAEKILSGPEIEASLDDLVTLRLEIFREYPYLYEGEREDELRYLRMYAEKPGAVVMLVQDSGEIAGAVTGIPLEHEDLKLIEGFAGTDCPLNEIYYVGEMLLYPAYRSRGLGLRLMAQVEEHVRSFGKYRYLTCATVIRHDDHPLRPASFVPIDRFLARTGFNPLSGVGTSFAWAETDGIKREHPMRFWIKAL